MPREPRRSRAGRWAAFVLFLAAAILALRLLGPGGAPPAEAPGPSPPSPTPSPSGVRGVVTGPDGSPAGGAEVEAVFDPGGDAASVTVRSSPTDREGRFSLPGAPPSWMGLRLRLSRGPLSTDIDLADAKPPLDLRLRLPAAFTVGGLVISAEDGRPLAGMEVLLGERSVRTDALGRFSFLDLPAALLERDLPPLEISGTGRKPLRRALDRSGRLDDLLLRAEPE